MGRSKADLAAAVYAVHGGLSRRESVALVDVVLERVRRALQEGSPVMISRFGSFRVLERRPRVGRNPRTGETFPIAGARRAVFRPSRTMVEGLNAEPVRKGRSDA